jgi:AI-2 transport protein TqsA
LSLVFWASVLGAMGALLAVPLTLFVKAVLVDADPDAAWLQPLLRSQRASTSSSPRPPPRPHRLRRG